MEVQEDQLKLIGKHGGSLLMLAQLLQLLKQLQYVFPLLTPNLPPQLADGTPLQSRLRSVLSYLSPFRSSKKQVEQEEEETDDQDEEQQEEESLKEEETDSADEAAQFALHGRMLPRESPGIVSFRNHFA